ncbi:hypothetical protein BJV74DRAFT_884098 [Russula compacta]|nr:hypothetical protein BJV74DRAFT_884098 [Russula compacta]
MSNAPPMDTDPWDRPLDDGGGKAVSARQKSAAPPSVVPDDWDEATSSGEEDNQRIWDDANKKVPMPQLVVTTPRMGSIPSVVPPAAAFQSPIRILKRSAAPTQRCASDDSSVSASTKTFAERSARYNAARERIFADTTETSAGEGGAVSAIIRNPKGPEHAQEPNRNDRGGSRGFGTRAGRQGSSNQHNEKQGQPQDKTRT